MYSEMTLADIENLNEDYPCQLIVMLYDEAIAGLRATIAAIQSGDIEARCNATSRVTEIVSHLYLALDMEQGGEIAENLGRIYNLIIFQMPQVNFNNDAPMVAQMINLLLPLRNAWVDLDERIRGSIQFAEDEDRRALAAELVADDQMTTGAPA